MMAEADDVAAPASEEIMTLKTFVFASVEPKTTIIDVCIENVSRFQKPFLKSPQYTSTWAGV